jgi:hypothetical protein
MAAFVVHMGLSPTEYRSLTFYEREALIKEHNKKGKK